MQEEDGFEPLVPREKEGVFGDDLIDRRPLLPARPRESSDTLARGTDGSNPASSSGESGANLIFGDESHR